DLSAVGRRPTSSIRRHGGCRGFTGPYPSTPLDELYEVVLTTLTDGDKALTDGADSLPGIVTLPRRWRSDALTSRSMRADPAGRLLIASNRGPASFSLGADGRLPSQRGGGGVATALSALAGRAEVLWVCAALNDADRAAARAAADGLLDVPLGAGDA